ncbi:MAG: 16S rRNA (cytosine(967)-C(5))-methyltransferase RsmB [Planctomycetaceae bacterium]|nr:16S rRNA (cytosine(967)-C(5))-methyltransferase RsmB [Planctomycetaceae bacterium]
MSSSRRRQTASQKRPSSPKRQQLSARRLAYDVLTAWEQRGVFAGLVLDDICQVHEVTGPDRAMAMDIAYGVIRRRATLDAVLAAFVDRPRKNIEDGLWALLQIGAYQLLLMTGVPSHAAVGETVEVAKGIRKPAWTGLLNGVLRSLSGAIRDADDAGPAVDRVPVDLSHSKQLDRAVLPDPSSHVAYLTKAFSYPRWLVRNWVDERRVEDATRLCDWFNRPPTVTIRVNLLRQTTDVVREVFDAAGVATEAGQFAESLRLLDAKPIRDLPGYVEGWFSVQDESAMSAARLLEPQPGERILDMCAAPGGKTTHLAELMQNEGSIIAVDTDDTRLARVSENATRLGLTSIQCQKISPDGAGLPEGPFDRVLVDVPCSNTGVLGKRPEARWRLNPSDVEELSVLQRRLLTQALASVRAGGHVVYSTCSIAPQENQQVVREVIKQRDDVQIVRKIEHIPGQPNDGGYQALLRREVGCASHT